MTTTTVATVQPGKSIRVHQDKRTDAQVHADHSDPSQVTSKGTDPLADLLKGTGVLPEDKVSDALARAVRFYNDERAGESLAETSETEANDLQARIAALRKQGADAMSSAREAHVLLVRTVFVIATDKVRGQASTTQQAVADALGVTKGRVSQWLAPMNVWWRTTGNTRITPDDLYALAGLVKSNGPALRAIPEAARQAATIRATETGTTGLVKVKVEDIRDAIKAAQSQGEPTANTVASGKDVTTSPMDATKVVKALDALKDRIVTSGGLTGDESAAIRAAESLLTVLRNHGRATSK